MSTHANERITERMSEAGFDTDTITKVYTAAELLAERSEWDSEAILLITLPEQVGAAWGERSNGNEVWAIVRRNYLVTTMLRRSTQPKTPEALKVSHVTLIG